MSVDLALIPSQAKSRYFLPSQLAQLDYSRLPKHIAIIPDGNRRWAKKQLSSIQEGHQAGADTLLEIVKAAKEIEIEELTFYSFSTENWNRSPEEVTALMNLIAVYLIEQQDEMVQHGIKLKTIGNLFTLPDFLQSAIREVKTTTEECSTIKLILALNYGSRDEICRAFKEMAVDLERNVLTKEEIDEKMISRYLDTNSLRDPELLIRTSGELRISNFLLWQISYAEIFVAPVLWPEFTPQHLIEAVIDYQSRDRRWGGT